MDSIRWAGVVGVSGIGPTRTFEIDVHLPGHAQPEPVVIPLADAADLHRLLGEELANENPGQPAHP